MEGRIIIQDSYNQGLVAFLEQRIDDAYNFFIEAIEENDPNRNAYVFLAALNKIPEETEQWRQKIDAETITWLENKAGAGDADAQNNLGFCYMQGIGVDKDINMALHYYQLAADKNHPIAQCNLGTYYLDDKKDTAEGDTATALHYLLVSAESRYVNAMHRLCQYYIEKNNHQAMMSLLEKAAELSRDPHSFLIVGVAYYEGQYVSRDYEKAVKYLLLAAEKKNAKAFNWLGYCYEQGHGVEKNISTALKYYLFAIDYGSEKENVTAYESVGDLYRQLGDYDNAFLYFELGAEKNDPAANVQLGMCYEKGKGVNVNKEKAFMYFERAAVKNYALGQGELGRCYNHGIGVTADIDKAIYYYQLAAMQGSLCAINSLGICYYQGTGVPRDYAQAAQYFKKAADAGILDAQFMLGGLCYLNGHGVEYNVKKATELLEDASKRGHEPSKRLLKEIKDSITQQIMRPGFFYNPDNPKGNPKKDNEPPPPPSSAPRPGGRGSGGNG